jgi:phospholipid/cholesterol/gamma-HCH transport system substrate-binding protein
MERDANYTAVGAFVILLTTLAGLFVYWYSDSREHRDYTRYEIYFLGSVSGLSVGGPVRYLGVDVGRVQRIRIDQRSADRVQVITDIDTSAPISQSTFAQLSLQGVTGLLYIDLQQTPGNQQVMPAVPSERYPVINSVRSSFDTFLATLPELATKSQELLTQVQIIFSPENTAAITQTLASLQHGTAQLPETMVKLDSLLNELRGATAQFRGIAQSIQGTADSVAPELVTAIEKLRTTADNIAGVSERLDQMVAENRGGVRAFTRDSLPEFERMVREARSAAEEFRELSRSLSDDPSRLIYKPQFHGVEIPR